MIQDIKRQLNGEKVDLELVDIYYTLKDIAMLTNYSQIETKQALQQRLHKIYKKLMGE